MKGLKKTISKFLLKIISVENIISAIEVKKINKCSSQVIIGGSSKFYPEASVQNLKNDPSKIIIGNDTHIRGQLLVYPSGGKIIIGNYCYIGEHSRIWSQNNIEIKNNVLISHGVNIHDTDSHPVNYLERQEDFKKIISSGYSNINNNISTKPILIADNAWISFNVTILKGVTIGEGAIVASGSVVTKDVPPFSIVAGNPAKIIKYLHERNEETA